MGYNFKKIATLDVEQLESETTDINDRAEYYEKNDDENTK